MGGRRLTTASYPIFDVNGNEVPDEEAFHQKQNKNDDGWYHHWMDDEGLPEPLVAESIIEPEYEIQIKMGSPHFSFEFCSVRI